MTFEEAYAEFLKKPIQHPFHNNRKDLAAHFFKKGYEKGLETAGFATTGFILERPETRRNKVRPLSSKSRGYEPITQWPEPRSDQ